MVREGSEDTGEGWRNGDGDGAVDPRWKKGIEGEDDGKQDKTREKEEENAHVG